MRGVDVGDGKEAASERRADANGLDRMHTDAARSGDDAAAAPANDGLDQVRRLNALNAGFPLVVRVWFTS